MKIRLNWALFLVTAAGYVFYPVWHLPLAWQWQLALLNLFIAIAVFILKSPLRETTADIDLSELKDLWPAILAAAIACYPFWPLSLPTGTDDQSHAGPAAFFLGRAAGWAGFDQRFFPLFTLAAVFLVFFIRRAKTGLVKPLSENTAALLLVAAGNSFFLASNLWGLADAVGRFETILRYPPLSKFLYTAAYLCLGITEAAPRLVQFAFISLTAVYMLKLLRLAEIKSAPRSTYLLVAFFPTFFSLSISTELEAGTVFFFTAVIYHFLKGMKELSMADMMKAAFVMTLGMFYKQLVLGLLFAGAPALLFLMISDREHRQFYFSALKTLFIPALAGLPFIVLSAHYGIRPSSFNPTNLFNSAVMSETLTGLFRTTGPAISILIALSFLYVLLRRRSLETLGVLYFSAAYYIMISCTEGVGYVRHSQPFYIAPVFYLLLFFNDTFFRIKNRYLAGSFSLCLAGVFLFYAALDKTPFQRKTIQNYYENVFPYAEVIQYLKQENRPLRIYAPAEVEPSHFYMAKYGLIKGIAWNRTMPADFSKVALLGNFRTGHYDYLLLRSSAFAGLEKGFVNTAEELSAAEGITKEKEFSYRNNKLMLLKAER